MEGEEEPVATKERRSTRPTSIGEGAAGAGVRY